MTAWAPSLILFDTHTHTHTKTGSIHSIYLNAPSNGFCLFYKTHTNTHFCRCQHTVYGELQSLQIRAQILHILHFLFGFSGEFFLHIFLSIFAFPRSVELQIWLHIVFDARRKTSAMQRIVGERKQEKRFFFGRKRYIHIYYKYQVSWKTSHSKLKATRNMFTNYICIHLYSNINFGLL